MPRKKATPAPELPPVIFAGSKYTPPGQEIRAGTFMTATGPVCWWTWDGGGGRHRLNVNVPDAAQLAPDEIAIKDYSENEGTLASLVTSGIVAEPHRYFQDVDGGSVVAHPICRILRTPRPGR